MDKTLGLFFGALIISNVIIGRGIGYSGLFSRENKSGSILKTTVASVLILVLSSLISTLLLSTVLSSYSYLSVILNVVLIVFFTSVGYLILSKIFVNSKEEWLDAFAYQIVNASLLFILISSNAQNLNTVNAVFYSLGAGLGVGLVLLIVSAMNDRLRIAPAPKAFTQEVLLLICFGLMALAFSGLAGII